MAPPLNISFLTAEDLGVIPQTITAVADDSGTTYDLFYKFTAPAGCVEVYVSGFGDLAVYKPTLSPWSGPASAPVTVLPTTAISAQNKPLQFPTEGGTEYFIEVAKNGTVSPANLTLTVTPFTNATALAGSILIPDANDGFPAVILSATADYTPVRYLHPFSGGSETGDVLTNGVSLACGGAAADVLTVRDALFNTIAVITAGHANPVVRTCQGLQVFYVATRNGADTDITSIDNTGTQSATLATITGVATIGGFAVSNNGQTAYYALPGANVAVKAWDIGSDTALPDLVAGDVNRRIIDILVLSDDSLIVNYYKGTVTSDQTVKQFDDAGSLLQSTTVATAIDSVVPRVAYAIDEPNSYWAWYAFPVLTALPGGESRIVNIKCSDSSVLAQRSNMSYGAGRWNGVPIDPVSLPGSFGHDNSCPFWIVRSAVPAPTTTTFTIRRQRRWLLPSSDSDNNMQVPTMQLLLRTGIGLLPDASGSSTPLGVNPEVRLRISKDGGKTWGPERARSAGLRGAFKDRVTWTRATGNYRNAVGEVTVDAPVDWQWLAMIAKRGVTEGSS